MLRRSLAVLLLPPVLGAPVSGQVLGAVADEELARLVDATLPLVEKHAGRRFASRPVVKVVAAVELQRLLAAELERMYAAIYPGYDAARRRWLAGTVAATQAPGTFGKYGFEDRVIYLAPERLDATLVLLGQKRELGQAIFRLVLAHELVHALQDEQAKIGQRSRTLTSEDAELVFGACIEGHATLVQQRVAAELGLEEADRAFAAMLRLDSVRQAVGIGIHEVLGRANRQREELSYLHAADRLRKLASSEGEDVLWRLVAAPPASGRFFFEAPAAAAAAPKWVDLFAGVEAELGSGRWFADRCALNEMQLRSELADLTAAEFGAFLSSLQWAGKLSLSRGVPTIGATVWALRFADEAAARDALAMCRRAAAAEEPRLRQAKGLDVRRFAMDEASVEAGEALVHDLHVALTMLQVQRVRVVWHRRGRDLVRIWDQNLGKETSALLAVTDRLLRRMAGG